MKMMHKFCAFAATVAGLLAPAHALEVTALTTQNLLGDQDYTGALGMDFTVISAIKVTQLGIYDSGADGFGTSVMQVGIFSRPTGALVGSAGSLTGTAGTLVGTDRFVDVVDFTLLPGNYSIVSVGFSTVNLNGNLDITGGPRTPSIINTNGGLIAFTGASRYDGATTLLLPSITDGGPANRYDAGTFIFAPVPEPSTYMMMLAALSVIGVVVKRRAPV